MNEPVTLVKVRKQTNVIIPAGGWMLIADPDEHFSEHVKARNQLLSPDLVNDDYEVICTGRVRNTHTNIRFKTAAERKAQDEEMKKANAALAKSDEEAESRQKKLDDGKAELERKAHAEKIAVANKENDAIRNRVLNAT